MTHAGVRDEVVEFLSRGGQVASDAEPALREALGHDYAGTEEFLLALLRHKQGVAARALERLGVSLEGAPGKELERALARARAGIREGHRAPGLATFLRDLGRLCRANRRSQCGRRIAVEYALWSLIPLRRFPVGKSPRDWWRTPCHYRLFRRVHPPFSRREALESAIVSVGLGGVRR